jgi:hypothetical protein
VTSQQPQNIQRARPFRSFTTHVADGRVYHVPRSEFLSHSPTGRSIILYQVDESLAALDGLLMTALEVHPWASGQEAA